MLFIFDYVYIISCSTQIYISIYIYIIRCFSFGLLFLTYKMCVIFRTLPTSLPDVVQATCLLALILSRISHNFSTVLGLFYSYCHNMAILIIVLNKISFSKETDFKHNRRIIWSASHPYSAINVHSMYVIMIWLRQTFHWILPPPFSTSISISISIFWVHWTHTNHHSSHSFSHYIIWFLCGRIWTIQVRYKLLYICYILGPAQYFLQGYYWFFDKRRTYSQSDDSQPYFIYSLKYLLQNLQTLPKVKNW